MSADHGEPAAGPTNRRTPLLIAGLVVFALLVFGIGYLLGAGNASNTAASITPTTPHTNPSPTETERPSSTESARPSGSVEPTGDLPDGKYFVRLTDIQGGEEGPLLLQYDLAYFLTGEEANQAAAAHGLETPVPNDYFIVNDNPKLRATPLAGTYAVKYIPEGNCCQPVTAQPAQFYEWMGETNQTDFPPKDGSWWWITIAGGEVTTIRQQYLP
jgi:hypothetical protein